MAREVQVTAQGYERLQHALQEAQVRRAEATRSLAALLDDALDLEDRSLQAAQNDLTVLDARIAELEDALERAVVMKRPQAQEGQTALGSVVTLRDEAHGRELRVQLVSAAEAAVRADGLTKVTDDSPVGKALPGRRVGETFEVELGDHSVRYTITHIE